MNIHSFIHSFNIYCSSNLLLIIIVDLSRCFLCMYSTVLYCTGSGKTYTFFGPDESMFASPIQSTTSGVVIRTFQELIVARDFLGRNGINMSFTAQLVEIYEEAVTDLLTGIQ